MTVISTPNAPAAIGPYSQGMIAGGLVFCSGQIPVDPAITAAVDAGQIEMIHAPFMDDLLNGLLNK